jgi:hypothetical protein
VADEHERLLVLAERIEHHLRVVLEARLAVGDRQVGGDDPVPAVLQQRREQLPAGPVVPGAVDEGERGHRTAIVG